MKRTRSFKMMLIAAAVISPQAVQAATWQVKVGAESEDMGRQAVAFLVNEIWINAGDSVAWTAATHEPHTVSFIKPAIFPAFPAGCPGTPVNPSGTSYDGTSCVNSGILGTGQTYTVRFPSPGNFKLNCLLHPGMSGAVHVLTAGTPLPHDQNYYDDQASRQGRHLLSQAGAAVQRAANKHSRNSVAAGTGWSTPTVVDGVPWL